MARDVVLKSYLQPSLRPERRRYTCSVCGITREITVRMIEKWVVVCAHEDTRGTTLPELQLREEGKLILD